MYCALEFHRLASSFFVHLSPSPSLLISFFSVLCRRRLVPCLRGDFVFSLTEGESPTRHFPRTMGESPCRNGGVQSSLSTTCSYGLLYFVLVYGCMRFLLASLSSPEVMLQGPAISRFISFTFISLFHIFLLLVLPRSFLISCLALFSACPRFCFCRYIVSVSVSQLFPSLC